jgi:hypothetical protein
MQSSIESDPMRAIFVSTTFLTVIGCTCAMPPQFATTWCADESGIGCLDRTATMPPTEPTPALLQHEAVRKDVKAAVATKGPKPSTQSPGKGEANANGPKVPFAADGETKRLAQPNDNVDRVINQAKATISAKIDEDPSSIELVGLKRGIRKNTLGVPLDTICGYVKAKSAVGNDADQKPFLYLVKENDAYVVNGAGDVTASAAYHNICK